MTYRIRDDAGNVVFRHADHVRPRLTDSEPPAVSRTDSDVISLSYSSETASSSAPSRQETVSRRAPVSSRTSSRQQSVPQPMPRSSVSVHGSSALAAPHVQQPVES